ncbi:MAG: T9SS type A sorting domain-containing protein [Flavobacteriales bacterium]|jgi:hypothetical protein|nr:MAG: T9SS type A sorting domain-containing protein [Flavobacteriales bacterium]
MRATFSFLIAAAPIITLQGQTLDMGNAPTIGSTWSYISCGPVVLAGTGEGQVWDASGAVSNAAPESMAYIDPMSSAVGGEFPNAEVALQYGASVTYYSVEEDGLYVLGSYQANLPITSIFTDPLRQFIFPAVLNDSWSDEYSGSYTYNGEAVSQEGEMSCTVSGLGDLVLPWGTVENVLRLDITEVYTEQGLGNTFEMSRTLTEFYRPGLGTYVARAYAATTEMNGQPGQSGQGFLYLPEAALVGIGDARERAIGMEVFPNPATDRATVVYAANGVGTIDLYDASGKLVLQRPAPLTSGLASATLDLHGLPAGVYTVRVQSRDGDRGNIRLAVDR